MFQFNHISNKNSYGSYLKTDIDSIIDQVTSIRYFLGEELFEVTDKATKAYVENDINLEKVIKEMSSLSSQIVALVFKSKAQKDSYSMEDMLAINKVSLLSPKLGIAERELYKVKKQLEVVKEETMKLTSMGMNFAQSLIELQDYSRSIITDFRHAGREVPKSDLEKLMDVSHD